jgi:hypothetical protein
MLTTAHTGDWFCPKCRLEFAEQEGGEALGGNKKRKEPSSKTSAASGEFVRASHFYFADEFCLAGTKKAKK